MQQLTARQDNFEQIFLDWLLVATGCTGTVVKVSVPSFVVVLVVICQREERSKMMTDYWLLLDEVTTEEDD